MDDGAAGGKRLEAFAALGANSGVTIRIAIEFDRIAGGLADDGQNGDVRARDRPARRNAVGDR
jgi:hypothetical protein